MEKDGFDWYKAGGITASFVAVLIILLAIYGASRLYHRSENVGLIKAMSLKNNHQEFVIKKLNGRLKIAENGTRVARAEAQKLLRAHKWVGIFRAVLPECIDDDWDGEIEKNEGS